MASGNAFASGSSDKLWDWIEVFIDRIDRGIKKLEKAVDNVYKTWTDRGNSLTKEITQVQKQLSAQQKAYSLYMSEANKTGLSEEWRKKIRTGALAGIDTVSDEDLNDKISDFKDFYEKALDAKDAIEELKEQLAELYTTAFENVEKNYKHQLELVEHLTNTYENGVDLIEAKGRLVGASYYKAMQSAEKKNNALIQKELSALIAAYNKAMNSGYIKSGSEQWYEYNEQINETKEALQESNIELAELAQKVREIEWDNFDYLEDRITSINDESEFMIKLLDSKELKDANGQLTDAGIAVLGLHGQSYNTYMAQADDYANAIKSLNKTIANDPNNTNLLERREKLYELQRKMILAAEDEKEAMADLVEDGYKAQLDAMKELIDEYTDSLDSAKDLYDYQKKVKKQTEEIASIQKQLSAYSGDTSEENRARIQKLQVDLAEAQEDLAETEYEKYIKDQKKILDDFYSEYEENINARIDNIDYSLSEMIDTINNNYKEIDATLNNTAQEVGYTMSDELAAIWDNSGTSAIISEYSNKFDSQLTSVNSVLASIDARVANMLSESEAEAKSTVSSTSTTTAVTKPKKSTSSKSTSSKSTTTKKSGVVTPNLASNSDRLNVRDTPGLNGKIIRQLANGNLVGTDYKESNGWLHIHVINNSENYWGWVNKQYVKAHAKGARRVSGGFAWTQEYGSEAIVRPTENAILTKLNSGDSVLNANATGNIFDFGNDPLGFLARLGIGSGVIDSASLVGGLSNSLGKANVDVGGISINIPIEHVEDYNDLVNQIKSDKKFEKFIQSITVDRLVGGSALAKNNIKW